jgi:4'-phosphopantetheinyl transferase
MIQLFFLEMNCRYDPEASLRFLPLLPEKRIKQIKSMRTDADRKILLYSDVLLRYLLCRQFSLQNKDIEFLRNSYGKPYLKQYPSIHFSVSHTRNAIAVALSDSETGVDVERQGLSDMDTARRAFTDCEYKFIYSGDADQDIRFYEFWTRKEAYLKWLGTGWAQTLPDPGILRPDIATMLRTKRQGDYFVSGCSQNAEEIGDLAIVGEESFLENAFRRKA